MRRPNLFRRLVAALKAWDDRHYMASLPHEPSPDWLDHTVRCDVVTDLPREVPPAVLDVVGYQARMRSGRPNPLRDPRP